MSDPPDHARPGASPTLEIERKYLLDRLPSLPPGIETLRIEQGYLPEPDDAARASAQPLEGRLRRIEHPDGSIRHWQTIKTGEGLVREERNRELTRAEFEKAWPNTAQRRLTKIRHRLPVGEVVWEIDEYEAFDLVVAEVELPDPETKVDIPDWLAPRIVREVTGEPAFSNYELAMRSLRGDPAEPHS